MPVQKWEYRIVSHANALPALGSEGWELVAVVADGQGLLHYLKRPAPSLAERITLEQRVAVLRQRRERP